MKVAIFYPHNLYASWYAMGGYVETLRGLGHEVLNCRLPGNEVKEVDRVKEALPKIEDLNTCDVIIVAYAEYVRPWLVALYTWSRWSKIKVPKILRFDESFSRKDLGPLMNWEDLKIWGDYYSFPARQDAEKFGGQWLPFGADLRIFRPRRTHKKYDLAFIGSLYPSRTDYLRKMLKYFPVGLQLSYSQVFIQDLDGVHERASTELLAENYRRIKIFFCPPPLSQLLICKVFEVLACGTFMMYPRLIGEPESNLDLLQDKVHLIYYEPGQFVENVEQIQYWLEHEEEREQIAARGCIKVHSEYSLKTMLESILSLVKDRVPLCVG